MERVEASVGWGVPKSCPPAHSGKFLKTNIPVGEGLEEGKGEGEGGNRPGPRGTRRASAADPTTTPFSAGRGPPETRGSTSGPSDRPPGVPQGGPWGFRASENRGTRPGTAGLSPSLFLARRRGVFGFRGPSPCPLGHRPVGNTPPNAAFVLIRRTHSPGPTPVPLGRGRHVIGRLLAESSAPSSPHPTPSGPTPSPPALFSLPFVSFRFRSLGPAGSLFSLLQRSRAVFVRARARTPAYQRDRERACVCLCENVRV